MFKKHGQKFIAAKASADEAHVNALNQDELFEKLEKWRNGYSAC